MLALLKCAARGMEWMFVIVFVCVFCSISGEMEVCAVIYSDMHALSFVKAIVCFIWQVGLSSYLEQEICTLVFKSFESVRFLKWF